MGRVPNFLFDGGAVSIEAADRHLADERQRLSPRFFILGGVAHGQRARFRFRAQTRGRAGSPVMVNEALLAEHLSAEQGEAMFRQACATGLEGHRLEAPHEPLQVGRVRELAEGEPDHEWRTGT